MSGKRDSYLVTGGAGLLGSQIVDLLLKRGETAVAVLDLVAAEQDSRVRVFTGDITDRHAFETAVREVSTVSNSRICEALIGDFVSVARPVSSTPSRFSLARRESYISR